MRPATTRVSSFSFTPEQIARYKSVRGYDASGAHQHGK